MAAGYWATTLAQRLSRRRALAATGSLTAGAALLAACGGGDSGTAGTSDLITEPKDTFKEAKRGGTLREHVTADPPTLDNINPQASLNVVAHQIYGTLLREKAGYLKPEAGELEGDLAESFEYSPDRLQVTLKLRPGVKWHNRAPVNGRAVDVDDVLFSWNRYLQLGPLRSLVANSVSPQAPVLSVTAPDARTIQIKLKEPVVYILNYFAAFGSHTGNIMMVPKETGTTFDIRRDMIGHGPFELVNYTPSVNFSLKRNPEFYDKDFALVDTIEYPVLPQYPTRLSQFKAGNLHVFRTINAEDVAAVKREDPRLLIYQNDFTSSILVMTFGQLPEGRTPFRDERVRQAISMAIDRDTWIDARRNVSRFAAEGLNVEPRWNSHLNARWGDWWLDPQGKDFGPNAKYFEYNLPEAKKLLAAAGHPNGFDVTSHYPVQVFDLGPDAVPLDGMLQELGLRIKLNPITDYNTEYIPNIRDGSGQYEGWGYHSVTGNVPSQISETSALVAEHFPDSGVTFHGYSTSGRNDKSGDPVINQLLGKARLEADREARKKLLHDVQRHLGKTMHSLLAPGGSTFLTMAWPAMMNYRVYSSNPASMSAYHIWLDQTKPPFTAA